MNPDVTLADGELLLRPWRGQDAAALAAAFDDDAMRRWLRGSVQGLDSAVQSIARRCAAWTSGTRYDFGVWDGERLVGSVTLKTARAGAREVGYWTVAAARGQGVAPRAVRVVTAWALSAFAPVRLELIHSVGNDASCRVAEKCGFRLAEILPPQPPWPDEGHLHVL
jgi:RimJ/RimL family protein N-acetyltransferase